MHLIRDFNWGFQDFIKQKPFSTSWIVFVIWIIFDGGHFRDEHYSEWEKDMLHWYMIIWLYFIHRCCLPIIFMFAVPFWLKSIGISMHCWLHSVNWMVHSAECLFLFCMEFSSFIINCLRFKWCCCLHLFRKWNSYMQNTKMVVGHADICHRNFRRFWLPRLPIHTAPGFTTIHKHRILVSIKIA